MQLPVVTDLEAATGASPTGPGIVGVDLVDFSLEGIVQWMNGDESNGIHAGMMTDAPELTEDPDTQNLLDDVVGLSVELKDTKQPGTQTVELAAELAQIEPRSMHFFQPGLVEEDWTNDVHAILDVGADNSQFTVRAIEPGTGGNAITVTLVAATGGNPTSVGVVADAITVNFATGATAADVVKAINGHPLARQLVRAGLKRGIEGRDGSGAVVAAPSAPLAGGAQGDRIGTVMRNEGIWRPTDYHDYTLVLSTSKQLIYHVVTVHEAINVDEWNPQWDDAGAITGIGVTWRGHATMKDRGSTGAFKTPITKRFLDFGQVV